MRYPRAHFPNFFFHFAPFLLLLLCKKQKFPKSIKMLSSEAAKAPAETKAKKSMKVQESASSLATIESAAGSVASSLPNRKPNIPIKASRDQFWPQETQQEGKMRLHCARLKEWLPLFDQLADYATGLSFIFILEIISLLTKKNQSLCALS